MINYNVNAKGQDCFFAFDNILGRSAWAKSLRRRIIQSARHRFNALVCGPPGSGKRLVARAIHEHGPRRDAPFIPVDCARISSGNLFRSQLFGQVYCETTSLGCLRAADAGTIYLANVNKLDTECQIELLEALDSREVYPVGSEEPYSIDVRVIAGSIPDLEREVCDGRFRSDLFARFCVLSFETVELRKRLDDIVPLADFLMAKSTFERGLKVKRFSPTAREVMRAYDWPGNVRELFNVIDDGVAACDGDVVHAEHLPIEARDIDNWVTLSDLQKLHIRKTIEVTNGNVTEASRLLGISVTELEYRLNDS